MKHFAKHTKCTTDNKVLILVDGHASHTKSIEVLKFRESSGIILLSLPPHTTHRLQPLDYAFFKPLKTAYNSACSAWMKSHVGRVITVRQFGEIFNNAYMKVASIQIAVNGFKSCGISPLNKNIIADSEYATIQDESTSDERICQPDLTPSNTINPFSAQANDLNLSPILGKNVCSSNTDFSQTHIPSKTHEIFDSQQPCTSSTLTNAEILMQCNEALKMPKPKAKISDIFVVPTIQRQTKSFGRKAQQSEVLTSPEYIGQLSSRKQTTPKSDKMKKKIILLFVW